MTHEGVSPMRGLTATIADTSPRSGDWLRVFGDRTVPIVSPVPTRATLPGLGPSLVYQLELSQIDADARDRLVTHIASRFSLPASQVASEIDAAGVPILAEDVFITVAGPMVFVLLDSDEDDDWDEDEDWDDGDGDGPNDEEDF